MKTTTDLINVAAEELFPGCNFSPEIKGAAVTLLERGITKVAQKSLRRAILSFRPQLATVISPPIKNASGKTGDGSKG